MKTRDMGRAGLFCLAMAPLVGTSVDFGGSRWTVLIGLAVMLLATGTLVGMQMMRARREYRGAAAQSTNEKISSPLVLLSSAAVLAIYSAGYFRTQAAANQFAQRDARATITLPVIPATVVPPAPVKDEASRVDHSPVEPPRRRANRSTAIAPPAAPRNSDGSAPSAPPDVSTAALPAGDSNLPGSDQPAPEAPPPQTPAQQSQYKDGTYLGWGNSRHGDLQVAVVIQGGQIVSADIAKCYTRYPCVGVIDKLPGQAVSRQSFKVDCVSGATDSSYAYMDAVFDALAKAKG
jgi:uncharacterized protein with FMN-binding domain